MADSLSEALNTLRGTSLSKEDFEGLYGPEPDVLMGTVTAPVFKGMHVFPVYRGSNVVQVEAKNALAAFRKAVKQFPDLFGKGAANKKDIVVGRGIPIERGVGMDRATPVPGRGPKVNVSLKEGLELSLDKQKILDLLKR